MTAASPRGAVGLRLRCLGFQAGAASGAQRERRASPPLPLEVPSWYDPGMSVAKIAVSLPREQVRAARRAVAGGAAPSFSAFVSEAIARRIREDTLADLVRDLVAERAPAAKDYAWADRALGPSPKRG